MAEVTEERIDTARSAAAHASFLLLGKPAVGAAITNLLNALRLLGHEAPAPAGPPGSVAADPDGAIVIRVPVAEWGRWHDRMKADHAPEAMPCRPSDEVMARLAGTKGFFYDPARRAAIDEALAVLRRLPAPEADL